MSVEYILVGFYTHFLWGFKTFLVKNFRYVWGYVPIELSSFCRAGVFPMAWLPTLKASLLAGVVFGYLESHVLRRYLVDEGLRHNWTWCNGLRSANLWHSVGKDSIVLTKPIISLVRIKSRMVKCFFYAFYHATWLCLSHLLIVIWIAREIVVQILFDGIPSDRRLVHPLIWVHQIGNLFELASSTKSVTSDRTEILSH